MNTKKIMSTSLFAWMAMSASHSAYADKREKNTWIGVGVGALAGGLLSNGDPLAMLGGAAAGGLVGNVTTHQEKHNHYRAHGGGNDHRNDNYRDNRDRNHPGPGYRDDRRPQGR